MTREPREEHWCRGNRGRNELGVLPRCREKGMGWSGGRGEAGEAGRGAAHGELPSYFHSACSGKPLVSEGLGQWVRKRARK